MVLSCTRRLPIAAILLFGATFTAHAEAGLASTFSSSPLRHVQALQTIADASGGNRAAGTPGYDRSAEYVANQLRNAGYKVRLEEFTFPFFDERSPPLLVSGSTHPGSYTPPLDALRTLRNSGGFCRLCARTCGAHPAWHLPIPAQGRVRAGGRSCRCDHHEPRD